MSGDDRFDFSGDDGITVDGNEVDTELHPTNNQADEDQHEMGLSDEFKTSPENEGDIEVGDTQAEIKEQLEAESGETPPEEPPAEDPTSADTRQEAKKKRTEEKLQKRMDRMTRKIGDLERENLELRQQTAQQETLEEPDAADFDNYDDFEVAHKAWQEASAEPPPEVMSQADLRFEQAKQRIRDDASDWDECPDDWELTISNNDIPFDERTIMAVSDSENQAEVMYYLAQNPSELLRLQSMSMDANLVRAIDKIEDKLSRASEPPPEPSNDSKKRTATQADTPIEPLGGGIPPKQVDLDKATFQDFEKEMNRQEQGQDGRFWS